MHLPLFVLSSVCLRTSKCLSMGELISVIFVWVALVFGNSSLAINMHYFVIHALMYPITLGFRLYRFFITDFSLKNKS